MNRRDDAAIGEEADEARQHKSRQVDDEDLRARLLDGLEGGSGGAGAQVLVVLEPFAGYAGQRDAGGTSGAPEAGQGFVVSSSVGQVDDLPRFDDVLPIQILETAEKLAVALIADGGGGVLLEQLGQRPVVLVEGCASRGSLALVGSQQRVAHAHTEFGKACGDASERRHASELFFCDESAALLDLRQANPGKHAEYEQRHQRNRHQDDEPFADGHGCLRVPTPGQAGTRG